MAENSQVKLDLFTAISGHAPMRTRKHARLPPPNMWFDNDSREQRVSYRAWLDEHRLTMVSVLMRALGLKRSELLDLLGVTSVRQLDVPPIGRRLPPGEAPRRAGRPRREVDRAAVLLAMQTEPSVRAAAVKLQMPRATLSAYLARELPAWAYSYGVLAEQHVRLLHESAISPEQAQRRGYRSVADSPEGRVILRRHGFIQAVPQPGLLIPVWSSGNEIVTYQYRPDQPRGRGMRYFNPRGRPTEKIPDDRALPPVSGGPLDVPPGTLERVLDDAQPLWVTEGVRKADAAASAGLAVVALLGVRSWPDISAWTAVGVENRDVYIAFDSDAVTNREVAAAETRLVAELTAEGARVRVVRLPPLPGHRHAGLDDHLFASGLESLLRRVPN